MEGAVPSAAPAVRNPEALVDVLAGTWNPSGHRRFLVVDRTYQASHRHGHVSVEESEPPENGVWPHLHLLTHPAQWREVAPAREPNDIGRVLFIDLETTGLAGGAGTYAFLVGFGWFDGPTFRTRQLFLADYAAERILLEEVAALAGQVGAIVSYNGKTFDVPLIETRFLLHRLETPFSGVPHVDMLHPARRLWRRDDDDGRRFAGCRLVELEETLCGFRRVDDVPGWEIPSRYFGYVRSGDARPLAPVLEHNRLDLLSLALVTARATRLLEVGPAVADTAREALGAGVLYQRGGRLDDALVCFAQAAGLVHRADGGSLPGDVQTRAQAVRAYAMACRRLERHEEAAAAWGHLLALSRCPPALERDAAEALAVHHEHRLHDFEKASVFAQRSLELAVSRARRHVSERRMLRLERKRGVVRDPASPPTPLF